MALHLKEIRKVAVLGWDIEGDDGDDNDGENVIKGSSASMQVDDEEKRTVKNDGESNLFFPQDFTGDVRVVVEGSKSGRDSGVIHIP
jgi:hypothetical protein